MNIDQRADYCIYICKQFHIHLFTCTHCACYLVYKFILKCNISKLMHQIGGRPCINNVARVAIGHLVVAHRLKMHKLKFLTSTMQIDALHSI